VLVLVCWFLFFGIIPFVTLLIYRGCSKEEKLSEVQIVAMDQNELATSQTEFRENYDIGRTLSQVSSNQGSQIVPATGSVKKNNVNKPIEEERTLKSFIRKLYLINIIEGFFTLFSTRRFSYDDPELDILEWLKAGSFMMLVGHQMMQYIALSQLNNP
jgi:hypothetical protein